MSPLLAAGAVLAFGIGLAHSVLGERYILIRLFRRRDLPKLFGADTFTRRTLRFAWHLTTIAWWGFAAQMALASRAPVAESPLLQAIAGTFLASALLGLAVTRARHLAWPVFLAIAACAWLAG
ncbi:MAG TPA: hypothetical protein VJG13_04920 [Thermoanaerobaculia bacterium]|nr:hypothetical protein [Thermoanaerobaculia bacterium]